MAIDSCPAPTTPVRGVVRFVAAEFKAAYPEFAAVSDGSLLLCFTYATLLLNNSCSSMVCDANTRQTLLYLLTAHIAALFYGANGQIPSGAVGRVAKATQGSVSADLDMGETSRAQAWYLQTQWGALYWTMTGVYRQPLYVAPEPTCAEFPGAGFGGFWGGRDGGCC